MEQHTIVIIPVIGLILILQLFVFSYTLKKINLFKTIFSKVNSFLVEKFYIPENEIGRLNNEDINNKHDYYSSSPEIDNRRSFTIKVHDKIEIHPLIEYEDYIHRYESIGYKLLYRKLTRKAWADITEIEKLKQNGWSLDEQSMDIIDVLLVQSKDTSNIVMKKILNSINTYLLRNKGAISDFNLVKDIVERNCDAEDEQINTLLPIPLYLGLMGTMAGIIIGLFAMPPIQSKTFDEAIPILIGGVKIAMVASLFGLGFTTLASGVFYKGAKSKVEGLKNDFYTFIQTELLPSISNSATNSIVTLQNNLLKFNEGFTSNIVRFDGLLTQILSSFNNQMSIVNDLKDIDVAKIARFNIEVLKELRLSAIEFEKFNQYIHQVNALVSNASELNTTLKSDLADIDNRKYAVQQAFTKVNDSFEKGLIILKESTDDRLRDVKRTTDKQQDAFEKYLENSKLVLKEIIDKEKGLLIDQLDQNEQILNELKKQSELRESLEKVGYAINSQNKLLSEQNKTLAGFGQSTDELNKNVKRLSSIQNSSNNGTYSLPPFARNLAYAFVTTGIAAFIAVIIFIGGRYFNDQQTKDTITNSTTLKTDDTSGIKNNTIKKDNIIKPSGNK